MTATYDVAAIGNGTCSESRRQPAGDAVAEGVDVVGSHQRPASLSLFAMVDVAPCPLARGRRRSRAKES